MVIKKVTISDLQAIGGGEQPTGRDQKKAVKKATKRDAKNPKGDPLPILKAKSVSVESDGAGL